MVYAMKVKLTQDDLIKFVDIASHYDSDIDVNSVGNRRTIIDGKSLLGMVNLDLSKPLEVRMISDDSAEIQKFQNELRPYIL